MANIDGNEMRWNGKLSGAVDLLYYDKENVDVVEPPYAGRDRNSSFFLKTRRGYVGDDVIKQFLYDAHFVEEDADFLDRERDIADVKILWDDTCTKDNGVIYYLCVTKDRHYRTVVTRPIENGCMKSHLRTVDPYVVRGCKCSDDKLFVTTYVKGPALPILVHKSTGTEMRAVEGGGVQINRKEGGVTRGYFTISAAQEPFYDLVTPQVGDYVVAYGSTNTDTSGFCGQVRTVIGRGSNGEIMVNAPRLGFKDELDENEEVRGDGISFQVFREYGEVVGFTSPDGVELIVNPFDEVGTFRTLTMCDFNQGGHGAGCIISSTADVNRVYFLYENGYIHYGGVGMNKFFSLTEDTFFAGRDKTAITTYRDMILAFGRRHIAVGLWDDNGIYARMYNQSTSIGLKNRYAFGEYNGDLLFVSNDNRLLALQFENGVVGSDMLNFQDVGAYINPFLKAMLPTDECFVGVDNNELRVFITSKADIDRDGGNSKTMIFKYNTIFQTWTVDVLKYFLIRGCHEGLYYGDDVYYRGGYVDKGVKFTKFPETGEENYTLEDREYQVHISAYLLENEENGMGDSSYGALDLFRLASLEKLMILLGTGRYSDELTKIKITERRGGWGREYEINCLENNDWVKLIGYAYNGEQLEQEFLKRKQCVIDSLNDGSKQKRVRCEEGHKIQDPIPQVPWCDYSRDIPLGEHNVCINDEVYELAPTMPLTIQLGDQENYNTEIKVELISTNGDIINFGGFMALLHLATLGQNMGGDGEYQIVVDSGC